MILPHCNPVAIAEQIREAFAAFPFETSEGDKHFTLSLGTAIYDKTYPSGSVFFEKADNALYYAKKHGKNRVILSGSADMKENNK